MFDCKSKYGGTSLNDQVLQGPDLTNKLVGVLLRFREGPVAMMADIEGMFHQVRVTPEDCDVLRYLWWPDGDMDQAPEVYRMKVHLFGGRWSPSCCSFVLQRTAEDHRGDYDMVVVDSAINDFYVDDLLKSMGDEEKAVMMVEQLRDLMSKGGFRLTKWISNNRTVLASIEEKERAKQVRDLDLNFEALPIERALGGYWDVEMDRFSYHIVLKERPLTRRGLLSVVSSMYGPLGFASPFIMPAKKLIQDLSRAKLGWDDALSSRDLDRWECWKNDLAVVEGLQVDRCITSEELGKVVSIQLHHFSDASESAYGACSYIRMVDCDGEAHTSLLIAKSRLAPLRGLTIPRLELAAASVSVKLDTMLRRELTLPIHESVYWTDSMLVLHYIASEEKRFQTYVENRVSVIRRVSTPQQWRYVPSAENPADDLSRGLTATEMIENERWFSGPRFLRKEEDAWPAKPRLKPETLDNDPEIRKSEKCMAVKEKPVSVMDLLIDRRSSW